MLELESVTWQNFMSYGDYPTTLNLNNAGQCLITGEVIDNDNKEVYDGGNPIDIKKSNGAGKSTAPNAIQWCLFGRTMHSHSPGDKVINYFTGKDCRVTVEFKNGDRITRTRNTGGHNELFFIRNGEEQRLSADTLSVSKNQQARLNKEFGLDWEIFCGSVFFNQYGKPWMEMADQARKKAIERVLHIDRFLYYAKVAKDKATIFDNKVEKLRGKIELLRQNILSYESQINRLTDASANFTTRQKERQKELLQLAIKEKQARDSIELPDLQKLEKKWQVVKKIKDRIQELNTTINSISSKISEKKGSLSSVQRTINAWKAKAGKICTDCEQDIPDNHTASKIEPLLEMAKEMTIGLSLLEEEKEKTYQTIKSAEDLLIEHKPDQTVFEAKEVHKQWERHNNAIERYKSEAKNIVNESNPHDVSISDLKVKLEQAKDLIKRTESDIERDDYMSRHYQYIHKAYNDRTKIKSFVFQDHIPFINSRLNHYLDVFGLDVKIELTNSLGVTSNMWGYDFESGGERKRTDVAFMLAMFDFHEAMYGRQCNVLVLDEVDGRLDDDGIDALIGIIKNDLAPKVETVLVISHRNMMFDTFPNEIKVTRTNRFSQIL